MRSRAPCLFLDPGTPFASDLSAEKDGHMARMRTVLDGLGASVGKEATEHIYKVLSQVAVAQGIDLSERPSLRVLPMQADEQVNGPKFSTTNKGPKVSSQLTWTHVQQCTLPATTSLQESKSLVSQGLEMGLRVFLQREFREPRVRPTWACV